MVVFEEENEKRGEVSEMRKQPSVMRVVAMRVMPSSTGIAIA